MCFRDFIYSLHVGVTTRTIPQSRSIPLYDACWKYTALVVIPALISTVTLKRATTRNLTI